MKLLFVYDHQYPEMWKDGLWAALKIIEQDHEVAWLNLRDPEITADGKFDFVLGWGAFNSPVDQFMREIDLVKGICIAGNAFPPPPKITYDVYFYETSWYADQLYGYNAHRAFGVNTEIFHPQDMPKLFDTITVGAYSLWKRQYMLADKSGANVAVGEFQRENAEESTKIVRHLMENNVACFPLMGAKSLAALYNMSRKCYIPADVYGGGERAIWEAMACGLDVECEMDNPKLKSLMFEPYTDHIQYADSLLEGIKTCVS